MQTTTEIFFLPYNKDKFILYAPLKRTLMVVTSRLKEYLENNKIDNLLRSDKDVLKKFNIIGDYKEDIETLFRPKNKHLTALTIFLTTDCNLRCIYCYAAAGEKTYTLDIEIVKKLIDNHIKKAVENKEKFVHFVFHGGGEPTYKWDLFKQSVEYIHLKSRENNLKPRITMSTNLFLSKEKLKWVVDHLNGFNVSFDGPKGIQDYQRPTAGNKGTFDVVFRNLLLLKKWGMRPGIRSTITKYSVDRMTEILKFFKTKLNASSVHFEPVFISGRAERNKNLGISPNKFIENFKKAYEYASFYKIRLYTSYLRVDMITSKFCGAVDSNIVVLPNMNVTRCFEVDYEHDPRSKIFFIGKIDKEGNIHLDQEKVEFLKKRVVTNIPKCSNCFAKWNCAGGCLAKSRDIFKPDEYICKITKSLTKFVLERLVERKPTINVIGKYYKFKTSNILRVVGFNRINYNNIDHNLFRFMK